MAPVILADAVSRPRRDKSSAGSGGVVAQKPGRREKSIPPRRAPLRDAFGTRANACVRVFARDSRRAERAEMNLVSASRREFGKVTWGKCGMSFVAWNKKERKRGREKEREN